MKKIMLVVICMLLMMVPFSAYADETEMETETSKVVVRTGTDDGVNIRVAPSIDSAVYNIVDEGTVLEAFDEYQNNFRKILYDGEELWVYSPYLEYGYMELKKLDDESMYTFDSEYGVSFYNYPDDFTGIIVDKSIQKMKLVVTGLKGSRDTPTGEFEIWFCEPDHYFTNYDVFSYYFMPLKYKGGNGTDYAFHDATWRYEFGGDIYEWDGSHGCINMSLEEAERLYEKTYAGMSVYIIE